MNIIEKCLEKILNGGDLSFTEAQELASKSDSEDLYKGADDLRTRLHKNRLDLCSIVNAKSGVCSEDCKFCAQSMHYNAEVTNYEQVDTAHAVLLAKDNEEYGVERFSLVTAGRSVSEKQLNELQKIYRELQKKTNLSFCASMGFLTEKKALKLKEMGVSRYHCNLEASRSVLSFLRLCGGEKVHGANLYISRPKRFDQKRHSHDHLRHLPPRAVLTSGALESVTLHLR